MIRKIERQRQLSFLLGILLLAGLGGCHAEPSGTVKMDAASSKADAVSQQVASNSGASLQYAGSESCRECHEEISQRYSTHPMARSAGAVNSSMPLVESFDADSVSFEHLAFSYDIERSDDGNIVHAETYADGTTSYAQALPIDFYVGSGTRGRSYLLKRNDMLFQSPITWYTQAHRWDLSPGYGQNHRHFDRRISGACVACHFGRPNPTADDPDRFKTPVFKELGIGCENCHGPAAAHVAWHSGQASNTTDDSDPILSLGTLEPSKRASICNQCHLIASERVLRRDKTPFSFQPGEDLEETWVCFVDAEKNGHAQQKAVSQVEQMVSSTCFQKSSPAMQCTSCHDPHYSPKGAEAVTFYRQQCLSCHATEPSQCSKPLEERVAISESDSCVECHMPKLPSADVVHTSLTDHRILRSYPAPSPSKESDSKAFLALFADTAERLPADAVDRALMIVATRHCLEERDQHTALKLLPIVEAYILEHPDDMQMVLQAGSLYYLIRDSRKAQVKLEQVLAAEPKNEEALRKLFLLAHESNSIQAGIYYGRALLEINEFDADVTGRLIHLLGQTQDFDEAVELARVAAKRFPADQQIKTWLARAEEFIRQRSVEPPKNR